MAKRTPLRLALDFLYEVTQYVGVKGPNPMKIKTQNMLVSAYGAVPLLTHDVAVMRLANHNSMSNSSNSYWYFGIVGYFDLGLCKDCVFVDSV